VNGLVVPMVDFFALRWVFRGGFVDDNGRLAVNGKMQYMKTKLVDSFKHFLFSISYMGQTLPIDFHIFQDG